MILVGVQTNISAIFETSNKSQISKYYGLYRKISTNRRAHNIKDVAHEIRGNVSLQHDTGCHYGS